jgi:murein DD-endopeptidase MepM/ murein hydrolase activator NlpD
MFFTQLMIIVNLVRNLLYKFFKIGGDANPENQNWWSDGLQGVIKKAKDTFGKADAAMNDKDTRPAITWPVAKLPAKVTSKFGWRTLKADGKDIQNFHSGVDFSTSGKPDAIAVEDMIIDAILDVDKKWPARFKWTDKGWVSVGAPTGRAWTPFVVAIGIHTKTKYKFKHIAPKAGLKVGQKILCGAVIGKYGQLGYSMGEHCHFEVWPFVETAKKTKWVEKASNHPEPVDPWAWFQKNIT